LAAVARRDRPASLRQYTKPICDAPRSRFSLRRDVSHVFARLVQDRGWRRFRRAAVEGRFRRVDHVKLDRLRRLDPA
jgi:hypothetical protein